MVYYILIAGSMIPEKILIAGSILIAYSMVPEKIFYWAKRDAIV